MKPALIFLLLAPCAAGCKHSSASSSETHTETSTTTESSSSETGNTTTVTTQSEAPGKTTTTVEEFAPPNMLEPISPDPALTPHGADGGHTPSDGVSDGLSAGHSSATKVPRRGPLVKRTVTITERGAETSETRQEATQTGTAATETHAAAKGDAKAQGKEEGGPSAGCIGASRLIGLGILVFAVALIAGILKFRKAV